MPLSAEAWSHWSPAPGVGGTRGSLHTKIEQFIDQGQLYQIISVVYVYLYLYMYIYIKYVYLFLFIILIPLFFDLYPHYVLFKDVDMEHVGLLSIHTQGNQGFSTSTLHDHLL